jgi:DNA-binding SARP family transcriptional activator
MQYLAALGRPDWAAAQFRHCQAVLAREFGIEPLPETQRLYREIMAQEKAGLPGVPNSGVPLARVR